MAGDAAAVKEAEKIIDDAEFVVLKEGLSRYAARTIVPVDAEIKLREIAAKAVKRKGKPFVIDGKIDIELEFQNSGMADNCMIIPGISRKDGYTVRMEAGNMVEAYNLFRVMVSMSSFDHAGY